MRSEKTHIILCSGASLPSKFGNKELFPCLKLNYNPSSRGHNVNIRLPHFVESLNCHIPDRFKDLLEIAGYIYAADRNIKRGNPDDLEYHSWARNLHFFIKVRDFKFWNSKQAKTKLSEALLYVSGDNNIEFTFEKGGKDVGQKNLFDDEKIQFENNDKVHVALFSGGMDSLAGIIETLETTEKKLILVSHRSNPGTTKTQKGVFNKLQQDYPDRITYYHFECTVKKQRPKEETQRTRIFLYTSIAFTLSSIFGENELHIYENGITSINFSKRADLINARASRTTHPQTLHNMNEFFSSVSDKKFVLRHPFLFKTKTDVFEIIKKYNRQNYIDLTVTCTKTFLKFEHKSMASHCGGCSQCIDRRFAAFASNLEDYDATYDFDLAKDSFIRDDAKTHLCDYIKLAYDFNQYDLNAFYYDKQDVLSDLVDYIDGQDESEKVETIFNLCKKHFQQISISINRIRSMEDVFKPKKQNSFFTFIEGREFFKDPVERFIEKVTAVLSKALPEAYNTEKPKNENALNDFINAFLMKEKDDYKREFPAVEFSFSKVIPDHSFNGENLFIEAKYLRGKTAKSTITDGIASDITKYPEDKYKLFLVYDPERKITNDDKFKADFEKKPKCKVCVIR